MLHDIVVLKNLSKKRFQHECLPINLENVFRNVFFVENLFTWFQYPLFAFNPKGLLKPMMNSFIIFLNAVLLVLTQSTRFPIFPCIDVLMWWVTDVFNVSAILELIYGVPTNMLPWLIVLCFLSVTWFYLK